MTSHHPVGQAEERAPTEPDAAAEESARSSEPEKKRYELTITILVDVISPLVGFYGLRLLGVDQWLALVLGGLGPALRALYMIIRYRKADTLALFMLSIVGLTLVTSYISGSARLVLAKEGWVSAAIGLWMLSTNFFFRYPFVYTFGLSLMRRITASPGKMRDRFGNHKYWTEKWERMPEFHRPFKVMTAIWAIGGIVDAAARVVMAYTLPIDVVPILHIGLYLVLYVIMQAMTLLYSNRPKVKELLWATPAWA